VNRDERNRKSCSEDTSDIICNGEGGGRRAPGNELRCGGRGKRLAGKVYTRNERIGMKKQRLYSTKTRSSRPEAGGAKPDEASKSDYAARKTNRTKRLKRKTLLTSCRAPGAHLVVHAPADGVQLRRHLVVVAEDHGHLRPQSYSCRPCAEQTRHRTPHEKVGSRWSKHSLVGATAASSSLQKLASASCRHMPSSRHDEFIGAQPRPSKPRGAASDSRD